jgi:AcrR family transcriptional regulator
MATARKTKSSTTRKPRADAARNRDLLLGAAKAAFAQAGADASLEEIARGAGVGIGTLYRHFPTREALIEAVYKSEADQLIEAAIRLEKNRDPVTALREWLLLFVDYIVAKHGMADVLKPIVGTTAYANSGTQVKQTIARLAERGIASGDISLEIEPLDLLRALSGVANLSAGPDARKSARRLVDVLIAGITAQK